MSIGYINNRNYELMNLENCVALVTGGNRGIGEAFVRVLLAEKGAARVYVGSRDRNAGAHLEREFPGRCIAIELDVTDPTEIAAAAAGCPDVNLLINNAGLFSNNLLIGAKDMSHAREEMEVNFFGPLALIRAFAPSLARNGGGAVINVLSAAAIVAVPNMGAYSPSKAAARMLSTSARAELASQGTHVAALIVGSVDTRMAAHVQGAKEKPEDIARVGLRAAERNIDELDTDRMAVDVRAALQLDPKGLEKRMAKMLHATSISTGR
jgi:NAD(P)-dependent dehydrogenase (short-subunit alcohol dehydrogenase family)